MISDCVNQKHGLKKKKKKEQTALEVISLCLMKCQLPVNWKGFWIELLHNIVSMQTSRSHLVFRMTQIHQTGPAHVLCIILFFDADEQQLMTSTICYGSSFAPPPKQGSLCHLIAMTTTMHNKAKRRMFQNNGYISTNPAYVTLRVHLCLMTPAPNIVRRCVDKVRNRIRHLHTSEA